MKRVLVLLILVMVLFVLAACQGGSQPEPAVEPTEAPAAPPTVAATEEPEDTPEPTIAAEPETEDATDDDATESAESEPEAEPTEAEVEEEVAPGIPVDQLVFSGTDPETGLMVNPEAYAPGDQFVVRGTIVTFNLTPQTSPEFLLEAPSGQRYRFRSQPLNETFFTDGSQLLPHEYRIGMYGQATVQLPPDAGPADILGSENFTLIRVQE